MWTQFKWSQLYVIYYNSVCYSLRSFNYKHNVLNHPTQTFCAYFSDFRVVQAVIKVPVCRSSEVSFEMGAGAYSISKNVVSGSK